MVRFEHDGMSLWYGTADAPAPLGNVSAVEEFVINIGVTPVDASNCVEVCYRLNQGPIHTAAAKWTRNDLARKAQYFKANLPNLRAGDTVEYTAVCRCAGRQIPGEEQAKRLEHLFRVVDEPAESAREDQPRIAPQPALSEAHVTSEVRKSPASPAPKTSSPGFRSSESARITAGVSAASPGEPPRVTMPQVERPTPALRVPTEAVFEIPNPTLNELASKVKLERAQEVLSVLSKHSINTLEDVRTAGGIRQLEGLGVDPDHPAVKALEGHANLSVLSADLDVNAKLIEKGYTSVSAVAETPQPVFLEATRTDLGEGSARQLYWQAQRQHSVLEHMRTNWCIESANGYKILHVSQKIRKNLCGETPCACDDCDTAVSPRAYLADLLTYTLKHVTRPGDQGGTVFLKLDDLQQHFHQPFRLLPGSCDAATDKVQQVRLCIEVLRRHLGTRDAAAEAPYRLAAYTTLLRKLGTSYQELRLACTADEEVKQQLADRLLITPDHLDQIRIEPASLTEEILETRFGLPSTVHPEPPLKLPETFELQTWLLEALRTQWKEQDWPADAPAPVSEVNGVGYMNPNPIMNRWPGGQSLPTGYEAEGLSITRRSAGTYLGLSDYAAEVTLASDQREGYFYQQVSLPEALRGGTVKFSIAARALPNDLAAAGAPAYQGVLSFDGSDDYLEVADTRGLNLSDEATFEAWIYPIVPDRLRQEGGMIVSQEGAFAIARFRDGTIRWAFEQDATRWRWVNTGYVAPVSQWTHVAVVVDARAGAVRSYANGTLVHTETAGGALKRTNAALSIGGAPSSRQHFEGRLGEVRIWNMARTEREIHRDRQQTLGSSEPGLVAYWRFDDKPDGDVVQDWTGTFKGLLGGGIEVSRPMWVATTAPIRLEVWQSVAGTAQTRLIERSFTPSDAWTRYTTPDVSLDQDADTVQLRVYVEKPVLLGGLFLETARRETFEPLVDTDVITRQHLRNPVTGDLAYELWKARHDWITQRLDHFRNQAGNPQARLDTMIQEALQVVPQTLETLAAQQEEGKGISESLELLGLSRPAFNYLHRMRTLVAEGNDLLQEEWEAVYSILVQVEKRRQFPTWRQDEKGSVFLSPDFFKIPEPYPIQFPPVEPEPPPAWRATWRDRRNWEDALQARLDQEKSVRESLRQAVRETQEEVLPMLRDLLIESDAPADVAKEEHAKALARLLLIDTQMDGCQRTTRVSQAIETVQNLLWSLRTGQLTEAYREWNFSVEAQAHFDEDWQWLGSYSTWRAAMFVYLYPENILHPTLRPWQSQGFQELIQQLRLNPRLNPDGAQQLADQYAEYYRDLTQLVVEATCQAGTRTYFYGRAPSGACYWSRYDENASPYAQNASPYAQTSWQKISSFSSNGEIAKLLGAMPFGTSSVLVFAKRKKGAEYQLVVAQHNLADETWKPVDEPDELELPPNTKDFQAVVSQIRRVDERPYVVIQVGRKIYSRRLNLAGDGWEGEDSEWTDLFDDTGFLLEYRTDGSRPQIDLKALVPVYDGTRPTCFSLLFYYSYEHNALQYTVLRFDPDTPEPEPLTVSTPSVRIRDDVWLYADEYYPLGEQLEPIYTDQDYVWTQVPEELEGLTYIRTKNAHKFSTEDTPSASGTYRLTFRVNQPVTIYVARDTRANMPAWMTGWLFTGLRMQTSDPDQPERVVYSKSFAAGEITLGGNTARQDWSDPNKSMYSVIIAPRPEDPCELGGYTLGVGEPLDLDYDNPPVSGNGWIGAYTWPLSSEVLVYFRRQGQLPGQYDMPQIVKLTLDHHVSLRPSGSTEIAGDGIGRTRSSGLVGRPLLSPALAVPRLLALAADSGSPGEMDSLRLAHVPKDRFPSWSAGPIIRDPTSGFPKPHSIYKQILPLDDTSLKLVPAQPDISQQQRRNYTKTIFSAHRKPYVPDTTLAYVEEYYYYVPLLLALELQRRGYYREALDWFRTVYDYAENDKVGGETSRRKIWYGLEHEEQPHNTAYTRDENFNWLRDPLNPHRIASTRPNTYTRYTLLSLVRCFLDYADAEFTRDTSESVPRARTLYTTVLELLDTDVLKQDLDGCEKLIGQLRIALEEATRVPIGVVPGAEDLEELVRTINDQGHLAAAAERMQEVLNGGGPWEEMRSRLRDIVEDVRATDPAPPDFEAMCARQAERTSRVHTALLTDPKVFEVVSRIGTAAGGDGFADLPPAVTGTGVGDERVRLGAPGSRRSSSGPIPVSGEAFSGVAREFAEAAPAVGRTRPAVPGTEPLYTTSHALTSASQMAIPPGHVIVSGWKPGLSFDYCIPPNPVPRALRLHAELNLYKARTCRNIAGMERELEPYAAPTDTESGLPVIGPGGTLVLPGVVRIRPTQYRYSILVERARHLVQLAGQVEGAMLAAIEKRDQEYYNVMKARQDMRLARQGVQLQTLRVREAEHGVTLAELQKQRAQNQVDHYGELLEEGISDLEYAAIGLMVASAAHQLAASLFYAEAAAGETVKAALSFGSSGPQAASYTASALSSVAGSLSTTASILSTYASYERRRQDWEFQRSLAQQDVLIGSQQVQLANDRVRITGQEQRIAEMQADFAEATADFLTNKFTNYHLYDWMSNILEGVYSFFLQQATAVAKLAENQLAFERQQVLPPFIRDDYWEAPTGSAAGGDRDGRAPDRRGLTGSARLLQDIYQLDQYAFETDKRKLQLTKIISLARIDPVAFQRFRETGVMTFETSMALFDRDFPGHYLRLIKRVRTSVIALIPPTQGIRATLSTAGLSRVVIGGDLFQETVVQRGPESVALTSPRDATGLFELQPQSDMLLPFEGMGVDAIWELRIPKASNPFDFNTLADVLITIEYTALDSFTYRQQVIQGLDDRVSADRPFSFCHQFADAWYDLHNPEQTNTPMTVRFETRREDFPPNIENLRIQHVVLYFSRARGTSFEIPVTHLYFMEQGTGGTVGGAATSVEGMISTHGSAANWMNMIGEFPIGEWELALPNTAAVRDRFKDEEIEDILLVITYSGRTPEWPA